MAAALRIESDDLSREAVHELLADHLEDMFATSPAESVHALDLTAMRDPAVTVWTLWDGDAVLGCVALKRLSADHAEVKSMRTSSTARGRGVATRLLDHLVVEARRLGYRRLSLETGPQDFFAPARRLYQRHGFVGCGPFGDYGDDPFSRYFTLDLDPAT